MQYFVIPCIYRIKPTACELRITNSTCKKVLNKKERMKKFLSHGIALCLLLASSLMVSCVDSIKEILGPDEIIADWSPVELLFEVHDADGNDLLDPALAGRLISETTITFQGKTYGVGSTCLETGHIWDAKPETRYYLPSMKGLQLIKKSFLYPKVDEDGYALYFGEIDGAEDMDEDPLIQWPDAKKTIIHYHCSDHKVSKKGITVNRWFSLDGKKTDKPHFEFIF